MNELQLKRLDNMVSNPYIWLLFIFVMLLPYILKLMRRLYPEKLRKKMEKEEACTLEYNQKPEVKLIRKIVLLGFLSSLVISYLIVYHLLDNVENKLRFFVDIFLGFSVVVMIIAGVLDYRIKKDKSCNDVIVGYKFMKIVGIIEIIILIIAFIIVTLKEWKVI